MPPKSNKRARPGEGSSAGESQEATPCVRNRDYATRKAILMVRPIIHERGIHVSTLENTTIPTIVEARKWEKFVASRGLANLTWVREFFASMVPETFRNGGCVLVRDVVVEISKRKINEHFGTTPVRQSALPLGYASFDGDSEKLAKLLRGNDDGVWTKKHPIRQSDLSKDVALINLFNSSSLRPVSHTSSILVKWAELIACYLIGGLIDVGRVIKAELNEAGDIDLKNKPQAKKKPVPFPYLITVLCREAGVPEFDNDEWAKGDKGDLNLRSWNDTTSKTKGRRKLWKLPSSRPRADSGPKESDEEDEEDEDFEPQEEELQEQEAEVEDVRADVAAMRAQLGFQTYQRRERRRPPTPAAPPPPPPPPSAGTLGFSAADYVPDDMTPADIERMRRGQSSRG
ncbi:hypothetical protein LWI29_010723 [Acer saccharum]|uniref:Putative plant transposon protein domain-containing protein n=1 Tax=Acer saccharum TaxID=4024 RepID=A0AA39RGW8_ACESA|nr:hypothetical protein LWI29_010723 [Acer saccharum]